MASEVDMALASEAPGNTKHRRFQLTLNQIDRFDNLKEYLTSLKLLKYAIACAEDAPDTGHRHIHVFVVFRNNIKLSINKVEGAHIEVCKGSDLENIDYITDESGKHKKINNEVIWEWGDRPHQGCRLSSAEIKKMEPIDIVEADPYNSRRLLEVKDLLTPIKASNWRKEVKVYYIWGPSATGKSTWVENKLIEIGDPDVDLVECSNGFWTGITGLNTVAVYEEFRHQSMKPHEFIKFIDYRKQRLNIKGASKVNTYTTIFITSQQSPYHFHEWHYEDQKQWIRRMEIINMRDDTAIVKPDGSEIEKIA